MKTRPILLLIILLLMPPACSQEAVTMYNGYYTAEAADFDEQGWKPFITIYVSDNKIVTVEYNAKDASGFIQSWDVEYIRRTRAETGAFPHKYARSYATALLDKQNPAWINPIAGAERSHIIFQKLSEAAVTQAKTGNKNVVIIGLASN